MKLGLGLSLSGQRVVSAGDAPPRTAADVLAEAVAWYEADAPGNDTTTEAGFFTTLDEKNGGTDLGAISGERPAVLDTAGVISAEYDGANDKMEANIAGMMGIFNDGGTYLGVFRPDTEGEGAFGRLWSMGGSDTERLFVGDGFETGTATRVALTSDFATTDGLHITGDILNKGEVHIVALRFDKSNPSGIRMQVNGTDLTIGSGITESTTPAGAAATPSGNLYVGNNNAENRSFEGGKYLDAFWSTELSDADVALIVAYAAAKYQ